MKCKKCGHENKQGAKFCEECGANLVGGVCPDCGQKNRADAQFCQKCGTNLVGGVCPDCGHKNRTDAQFCEECGANFKGVVKKSELPKGKSKNPGLPLELRIAFGVIGLIGLVSGALTLLGNSTEKTEAIDVKQEITRLSATVDAGLQTTPESTQLLDDVATNSSDDYLDELSEKTDKCVMSLTSWQALLEGAEDDTVLSDDEWIAEHDAALGLVEEYCTTIGWDDDVPAEFETANDLLLQSDSEYSEFIRLYRVGFSEMDEEILLQSTEHMLKAADFTVQAYELLP